MKFPILLLALILGKCLVFADQPSPERLSEVLRVIGNGHRIQSQTTLISTNPNQTIIKLVTQKSEVILGFDSRTGEIVSISNWNGDGKPGDHTWDTTTASMQAKYILEKLTGKAWDSKPDYTETRKNSRGTRPQWSVEWVRRIRDFKVIGDSTKIIFDENGTVYYFRHDNSVDENIITSDALLPSEAAIELAKKYALRVFAANPERFRGYKLGKVESAEKTLFTPVKGYDAASLILYKHDPQHIRPTWMVFFDNTKDSDYTSDTLAVPESKLMIWVDAETGDYCGANF